MSALSRAFLGENGGTWRDRHRLSGYQIIIELIQYLSGVFENVFRDIFVAQHRIELIVHEGLSDRIEAAPVFK